MACASSSAATSRRPPARVRVRGATVSPRADRGPDRKRDRVAGRPLSPRAFRPFGIEAVLLGSPTGQDGLVRRDGVALWRRLEAHAPLFDRIAREAAAATHGAADDAANGLATDGLLAIRVVTAATPGRDRAMRVPMFGELAARVLQLAEGPPPEPGWLLLVDEGPGRPGSTSPRSQTRPPRSTSS